ncbi:TPA: hypothetical protein ACGSS8_005466 [Pseudomonas aeruginosa]
MTDKLIRALRLAVDACENPSHRTHHTLQQQCRFLDGLRAALLPALQEAEQAEQKPAVRLVLVENPVYGGMHIRQWDNLAALEAGTHSLYSADGAQAELAEALRAAERFIAGFEGCELQEGIDELLTKVRNALLTQGGK